jgi:hypothetical protein
MDTGMTSTARTELIDAVRRRYRSAVGKEKRRISDEFIAATGYHEKRGGYSRCALPIAIDAVSDA